MDATLKGYGFCGFGQFSVTLLKSSTLRQQIHSNEIAVSSSDHTLFILPSLPTHLHVSSSWDSMFIHVNNSNYTASYASSKWLPLLSKVTEKYCSTGETISKVCEMNNSTLYLQTTMDSSYLVGHDKVNKMDFILLHYWSFSNGTAYCLTTSGDIHVTGTAPPLPTGPPLLSKVSLVANGSNHALILTDMGQVYSFGLGNHGQLGSGDLTSCDQPRLVEALGGLFIKGVACGSWHSLVVSGCGDMYSWGWNQHGQLGHSHTHSIVVDPTLVEDIPEDVEIDKVTCGCRHSCGVARDGRCFMWGWNEYGQIPNQPHSSIRSPVLLIEPVHDVICCHWSTIISNKTTVD